MWSVTCGGCRAGPPRARLGRERRKTIKTAGCQSMCESRLHTMHCVQCVHVCVCLEVFKKLMTEFVVSAILVPTIMGCFADLIKEFSS